MHMQPMTETIRQIADFERSVVACFGAPDGSDLPQIAGEDDTMIELLQTLTSRPYEEVAAELHHQIDISYQ